MNSTDTRTNTGRTLRTEFDSLVDEVLSLQERHARLAAETEQNDMDLARVRRRLRAFAAQEGWMEGSKHLRESGAKGVDAWLDTNERTIAWLARQCNVPRPHLSLVLSRRRECSPKLAARIAEVTGIPVEALLPVALAEVG